MYEVDYGPNAKHTACVNDFLKAHPDVVEAVYLVHLADFYVMQIATYPSFVAF